MSRSHAKWLIGVTTLLMAADVASTLRAAEPAAEGALEKLGLKPAGNMLILEAEAPVHSKTDEIRRLARELSNTIMQQRSTLSQKDRDAAIKELNAEINQFRSELNAANQAINRVPKFRRGYANNFVREEVAEMNLYKTQVQWEINQRTTFLNQLKSTPFDPKARDKLDTEVQEQRDTLRQAVSDLRRLVDTTHEKYVALAKDPAYKKALGSLRSETGTTFRPGPSRQFNDDVKLLEKLERMISPSDSGGAVTKGPRTKKRRSAG
jgi:hypothetical protein